MTSTYSDRLGLELQADGENVGTWGQIANTQFKLLEEASSGVGTVAHDNSADYTISTTDGTESVDSTTNVGRNLILEIGGALTEARNLVVPTQEKFYVVKNGTTGGYAVTVKTSGGSGISVPNGDKMALYCDGTNVVDAINNLPSGVTAGGVAVADISSAQTLTNKTIDGANNTVTNVGFESGTVMLFYQSAAPTGWTKDTNSTLNEHALRVVTSTAWASGSTGTNSFTAAFNSAVASAAGGTGNTGASSAANTGSGGTGNTGTSTGTAPTHTHQMAASQGVGLDGQTYNNRIVTSADNFDSDSGPQLTGSGGAGGTHTHTGPSHTHTITHTHAGPSHTHTTNVDVKYFNVIKASKV